VTKLFKNGTIYLKKKEYHAKVKTITKGVSDMGYILDWAKLREDASGFPLTTFRNPVDYDTIGYGYLIPLAEAEKRGYVKYKYDLSSIQA
jgi:hypothetical protein